MSNGETLLKNGKFEEALACFNTAIKQNPRGFKPYVNKGIALLKLRQYDDSIKATSQAFHIARERQKRELIGEALYRLFMVFYTTDKLEDAIKLLNMAQVYGYTSNDLPIWKHNLRRKIQKSGETFEMDVKYASLEDVPVVEAQLGLEEREEPAAQSPIVAKSIEEEKRELEHKMINKDNLYPSPKNIRVDWFQSSELVTISLFVKNLPNDGKLKIQYNKDSIHIEFPTSASSDFQYDIGPLYSYIDKNECTHKVFSTKVEIYLKKSEDLKWKKLERSSDEPPAKASNVTATLTQEVLPSYPTSSKKQTNWNNLKIEDDDNEGGSTEQFFQTLYKDADADAQRAMMKSYTESNGTVLSMDWKDVGNRKVEISPPDGAELKKL
jgi:suppressor of G2 allele of SKP1